MTDSTRRDFLKYLAAAPLAEFAITAVDLERVSALTKQTLEELAQRGWSDAELAQLTWHNAVRVVRDTEAAARAARQERGPSLATFAAPA